jgi:O-antigen/teichoic acid export membrane protein
MLSILNSAINYITQVSLIESYGYEARGTYELVGSIIAICSIIFSFNYYTALNLFVAKEFYIPKNKIVFDFVIGCVQIVAALILFNRWGPKDFNQIGILQYLLIAAILGNHITNTRIAILNGRQQFLIAKLIPIPGSLLTLLVLVYAISYLPNIANWAIMIAIVIPYLAPGVGSLIYEIFSNPKPTEDAKKISIKKFTTDNWKIYVFSISQILFLKAFIVFCGRTETAASIGSFGFANSVTQFLLMPITFIATIVLSKNNINKKFLNKYSMLALVFSIILIIVVSLLFSYLPELNIKSNALNNPNFIADMRYLIISAPFSSLLIISTAYLINKKQRNSYMLITQIAALPFILAVYYAINKFHIANESMAISYLFTIVVMCCSTLIVVYKK